MNVGKVVRLHGWLINLALDGADSYQFQDKNLHYDCQGLSARKENSDVCICILPFQPCDDGGQNGL